MFVNFEAGRELDAVVARIMGLNVVDMEWPCGGSIDGYVANNFPNKSLNNSLYHDRGPVYVPEGDEGDAGWPPTYVPSIHCVYAGVKPVPFYSTEMVAALMVVDWAAALEYDDFDVTLNLAGQRRWEQWHCEFYVRHRGEKHLHAGAFAETAPLAICRAFVRAFSDEEYSVW